MIFISYEYLNVKTYDFPIETRPETETMRQDPVEIRSTIYFNFTRQLQFQYQHGFVNGRMFQILVLFMFRVGQNRTKDYLLDTWS